MSPVMNIATRTLRQALEFLQQSIERQDFQFEDADNLRNRISVIEQNMHKIILQNLKRAYNDHYVAALGETHLSDKEVAWQLIPIHQPINLVRGLPGNAVSLTCFHRGKPEHAVIFNPSTGEEYTASRGRGATLNGRRIRASSVNSIDAALIGSNVLETGRKKSNGHVYLDLYTDLSSTKLPIYTSGCSLMDLAYVSAGKLDGAVLFDTDMNSLAPGILMAQESGALYGDFSGNTAGNDSKSIVCANPKLFKTILQKLYTYRTRLQP
ncbi:MAG: hypothetical protein H7A01_06545 [Hahellaceae bacterium]|nr:hypothetical protein [Hahellaceae bacterium]MCP5211828.1 hypothetical protein [Hahellaceae bacterium]